MATTPMKDQTGIDTLQMKGVSAMAGTTAFTAVEWDADGKISRAKGATVPSAQADFAVGCIFIKTDGSTGTVLYVNEGTTTSCTFNAVSAVTPAEIALAEGNILVGNNSGAATALSAKTSTNILVGNGTTVASVAISGNASMTNAGVITVSGAAAGFSAVGAVTAKNATAVPATASAVAAGAPIILNSNLITIEATTDVPTHIRPKGSLCINLGGASVSTRLYVNTDGAGTWTPVTTVA